MILDLVRDFAGALDNMPREHPRQRLLGVLDQAIRRDVDFIARHREDYPQGLFQCLWNSGWWYDGTEAEKQYLRPEPGWTGDEPWRREKKDRLSTLLETWRSNPNEYRSSVTWFEGLTPTTLIPLGQDDSKRIYGGHEGLVFAALFDPDERKIATSQAFSPYIRVWDVESGTVQVRFDCGETNPRIAWSPDGSMLVSGGDHGVRFWNSENGELVKQIPCSRPVTAVCFDPTGSTLFVGCIEKVFVMDVDSGRVIGEGDGHVKAVFSLACNRDGSVLFSSGSSNIVKLWATRPFRLEREISLGDDVRGTWVHLSRDERKLGLCERTFENESRIEIRDATTGELIRQVEAVDPDVQTSSIAWGSDDQTIAFNHGQRIRILNLNANTFHDLIGHGKVAVSVQFTKDMRFILSAGYGTAKLWKVDTAAAPATIPEYRHRTMTAKLSPDGKWIATVPAVGAPEGDSTCVRLLSTADNDAHRDLEGHSGSVDKLQWTQDGKGLVTTGADQCAIYWRVEEADAARAASQTNFDAAIEDLCLAPDERFYACACRDGAVYVVDSRTGVAALRLEMEEPDDSGRPVRLKMPIAFDPQMRFAACGFDPHQLTLDNRDSQSSRIYVWSLPGGALKYVLEGHSRPVQVLAFDSTGRRLASGARDRNVLVWNIATGERLRILEGHSGTVDRLAFTPDGRLLFSAQQIQSAPITRLWELETGRLVQEWGGCFDVVAMASNWDAVRHDDRKIRVNCERSNEFAVLDMPVGTQIGIIPTEYGSKLEYQSDTGRLISCDWKRLSVFRLNR